MEATAAASETSDGPVLNVINKRLRALRKKHNRILQMEESLSNGKTLNKEQEETFRSKPSVVSAIDELEKLRQPLAAAVAEEINLATQHHLVSASADFPDEKLAGKEDNSCVEDLLNIIYFGNMFDHANWGKTEFVSTMWKRAMHERACCLNYDCMPEDESTDVMDLLSEKDLDLISMLSELLIRRPVNSTLSHKQALQTCIEHAKLWVTKSDQQISPESDVTYAGLRSKLNKIMSSLYFTTEPVFRVEQGVAEYEPYPVPVEETVLPVNAVMQVESPVGRYQEKEEEHVNSQADISNEIHDSSAKELHQEENSSEERAEQVGHEGEDVENPKDANVDNQQSVPRRSHQNFRGNRGGGGRRGYSNGRGGRGRGRSYHDHDEYYDQPGNYYPRNYPNYRGRGGRGSRGGGNYSTYASGDQAGNVPAFS
ncbi:uncharacterized protein LOC129880228 [Solanum dulcamara]|uniref:uncharacterized protein LOC129880228 n=1 Tax=Solanum dulcamara TaxID=45834 RepID=UPI0024858662|nr:uncharacterized protein LOC129880228 [Solanum dulcamara]